MVVRSHEALVTNHWFYSCMVSILVLKKSISLYDQRMNLCGWLWVSHWTLVSIEAKFLYNLARGWDEDEDLYDCSKGYSSLNWKVRKTSVPSPYNTDIFKKISYSMLVPHSAHGHIEVRIWDKEASSGFEDLRELPNSLQAGIRVGPLNIVCCKGTRALCRRTFCCGIFVSYHSIITSLQCSFTHWVKSVKEILLGTNYQLWMSQKGRLRGKQYCLWHGRWLSFILDGYFRRSLELQFLAARNDMGNARQDSGVKSKKASNPILSVMCAHSQKPRLWTTKEDTRQSC